MSASSIKAFLEFLLTQTDPRNMLELHESENWTLPNNITVSSKELEEIIEESIDRGFITGTKSHGFLWSKMLITLKGLRECEAFPPNNRELTKGNWENSLWSKYALPILEKAYLKEDDIEMITGNTGAADGNLAWKLFVCRKLVETDYISARLHHKNWAVSEIRLKVKGKNVVEKITQTPFDQARIYLSNDGFRDAVIEAVEVGLGGKIKELANMHGVPASLSLSNMNERLGSTNNSTGSKVYDKPLIKTVAAILDQRNEFGHGDDGNMTKRDIDILISLSERTFEKLPQTPGT